VTNILIGIGGTGAKVVEAALTLFTAGLGPNEVHVGLIDQDHANGNVNRTQARLTALQHFQRIWGEGRSSSAIDWSGGRSNPDRLDLGSVRVQQLFGETALWFPQAGDQSLKDIIGQDLTEQQRDLFDLLFMQGQEEQDLRLGEGYRGRAHVGAAALVASMLDDRNVLLRKLSELMEQVTAGEPVRIFLVGSAFGGTGASGFPTLARELHRIRTSAEFKNKDLVWIGGALMLPYFGFSRPDEEGQPVVTTDELLPKARLALEYYGRLFETEKTFDSFYVLGWNPLFNLGYHKAGNKEQRNPPLVPELFGAAAAVDFLTRPQQRRDTRNVPVMLTARADRGLRWTDLPLPEMEQKLGQLIRFCSYWLHIAEPLLAQRSIFKSGNWTQSLRGKLRVVDNEQELESLRSVARDVLTWAANMQRTAREEWQPGLWNIEYLLDRFHEPSPTDPVALAATVADPERAFDNLIREKNGDLHPFRSNHVYETLLHAPPGLTAGDHAGYGRVVAAVYRAVGQRGGDL
jgi:hypothetical protein